MKMTPLEDLRSQHPPEASHAYEHAYTQATLSFEIARLTYNLRSQTGLTQAELAHRMNTSQSAIARMESGGHTPNLGLLDRLGKALGFSLRLTAEPVNIEPTEKDSSLIFGADASTPEHTLV